MQSIFRGGVMLRYLRQDPSPKFASLRFANFDVGTLSLPPPSRGGLFYRSVSNDISGGTPKRSGSMLVPMPELTNKVLPPSWIAPMAYFWP